MSKNKMRCLMSFVLMLAACQSKPPSEEGSAPVYAVAPAVTEMGRAVAHTEGAELAPISSEGKLIGGGFRASSENKVVTITVSALETSLVTVAANTKGRLQLTAEVNAQAIDPSLIYTGPDGANAGTTSGGLILVVQAGDRLTVTFTGEGAASIEGIVLALEPNRSALEHTILYGTKSLEQQTFIISVPSWLKDWVAAKVAKGIACWIIRQTLEEMGMYCPDKPWWLPNPYCVWEGTTCGYPVY